MSVQSKSKGWPSKERGYGSTIYMSEEMGNITPVVKSPSITGALASGNYIHHSATPSYSGSVDGLWYNTVNYEYSDISHLSDKEKELYRKHLDIYLHAQECMDKILAQEPEKKKGKKIKLFK